MTLGVRVESPYFVAGLELDEDTGVCVRAAPILKWCLGMHYRDIRPEFKARGFKARNMGCDGRRASGCDYCSRPGEECPLCGKATCERHSDGHGEGRCVDDGDPLDADPLAWGSE